MKKRTLKKMTILIMAGLLATGLSACGKTNNSKKEEFDSNKTEHNAMISASEAFSKEGIWFHSEKSMVTKDAEIDYILIFDGNKNVTRYTTDITYADLRDLSNNEIIELAKEQDKALFETAMQEILDDAEYIINDTGYDEEDIIIYNKVIDAVNKAQYQEPKSYPFTLKAETDGTGNQTVNEILSYTYYTWTPRMYDDLGWFPDRWKSYRERTEETDLFFSNGKLTVYDMKFDGFGNLFQKVDEDHPGFILDSPDTEGIEVD